MGNDYSNYFLVRDLYDCGLAKDFPRKPKIGFLAQAHKFSDAIARGEIIKPAKTIAEMQNIVMSNQINAALCGFFMIVSIVMIIASIGIVRRALASPKPTVNEAPAVYADPEVVTTRGE